MAMHDHIDKAGVLGAAFTALCCLGIPAVLSIVSAVGLGFLINDAILLPLLILSLVVTLWGLFPGWRRHGSAAPLTLAGIASAGLLIFIFVLRSRPFALASIGMLVGVSIANAALLRHRHAKAHGT